MDWMYRGISGLVDREEYLKGRKVDKTFEIIDREENPIKGDLDSLESQIPESLFDSKPTNSGSTVVTVDLAAKLREDPLYEIRVHQREQRRQLLHNPLKLKKLRNILESTLAQEKHKNIRKTSKTHKREKSDHSDDGSDAISHNRHKRNHNSSHYKSSSRESDSNRYKSYERERHERHRERKDYNNREYHKNDKKYEYKSRVDDKYRSNFSKPNSQSFDSKHKTNKLSKEELEKKRNEMMTNAVWRERSRKSNVKAYEEEELAESKFNESAKSAQFIKPLLKSVTETNSLEDRIKQKRFTSQRSYNSMDNNFAKKA